MSRGAWIRFIIVLGLLVGSAALALNKDPRLGLDLEGGAQFIFQAEGTEEVPATAENVDETLQVLRGRVDALGVAESTLVRQGEDRILVELPGVKTDEEAQEAEEQIGKTAQLSAHPVLGYGEPPADDPDAEGGQQGGDNGNQGDQGESGNQGNQGNNKGQNNQGKQQGNNKQGNNKNNQGQGSDGSDGSDNADNAENGDGDNAANGGEGGEGDTDEDASGGDTPGDRVDPDEQQVLPTVEGEWLEIAPAVLKGAAVTDAQAAQPENSTAWSVNLDFDRQGGDAWAKVTGEAACNPIGDPKRRVAIVLDGEIITSPQVSEGVGCNVGITGGRTEITGDFTLDEAKELAALIKGGSLPLELTAISDRLVGPSLGEAAIAASLNAGVSGLILTGLFIIFIYRLVGFTATLALASYALLAYAMLLALDATLTLPGLAGFVLAIGMAIDANVLVYERAREEYKAAPEAGLRRALTIGFTKAWSAIIDSNVTTLLAAGLLFFLGSGPIRGFGVTVSIGVVASMISALIVARVLSDLAVSRRSVNQRPMVSGIGSLGRVRDFLERTEPDLLKRSRTWLGVSVAAMALAVLGIVTQGLDLGVEFTGGRQLDYSLAEEISVDEAREAVADAGFPEAVVQTADTADFTIRTGVITNAEEQDIVAALEERGGEVSKVDDQTIGASLGDELRNNAMLAFGIAFLAQMAYLAVRFKWTFGLSAVATMVHDVLIVVGLFAWLNKPIDGIFLAAAMTIIGLSVNDTVVIFDRIRERWRASRPEDSFAAMANKAAVETIPRTVNTGLGSMFILASLAVFGGDSLRDFAIALLVGLAVGTYSSVFAATPLVAFMHRKWPMSKAVKVRRQERDPADSGAVV